MPVILQHIHDFTLVDELTSTILYDVNLLNRDYIRSAITAPSALRPSNYQRSEFLGDCVLKYVTSCHLFDTYPNWPEGYLSQRRSLLVCNATLACAAIRTGLGRYIISEPVDYRHWTLPSTTSPQRSREVSSKSLADVVEAVLGAAWLEAGIEAARRCINVFLPAMPTSLQPHDLTTSSGRLSGKLEQVEALIGYKFSDPALLSQALTHPSCAQISRTDSYERLEFLGDAVLDMLVAEMLAEHIDRLSQGRMTQIKAALVNADFLGFLCFRLNSVESHRAIDAGSTDTHPTET
ncbi:Dicer-like protein 2, partial [Friedmanniomyces endolithicus]